MSMIGKTTIATAAILAASMAIAGAAHAGAYAVRVETEVTNGTPYDAVRGAMSFTNSLDTATTANFTYTGPLSFGDSTTTDLNSDFGFSTANISNYQAANTGPILYNGASVANFSTEASFLASSGSTGGYGYGSLYQITLGDLAAGTVLTVTHDDGFSLYDNQTAYNTAHAGPTTQVTDTVVIGSSINAILYYARENGAPSVLQVTVPEPMSLSLFGTGLLALGIALRRCGRRVA